MRELGQRATSSRSRWLATGTALLVAAWAPGRALAWIPQGIPSTPSATGAGTPWLYGDSGSASLPMVGTEAQLGGLVTDPSTPRLAFSELPMDHGDWVSGSFNVADGQMLGMNWVYWTVGMAAGALALAAAGNDSGADAGGGHRTTSSAPVPAPEPSSMLIFALGALLVGWSARRRLLARVEPGLAKLG